MIVMHVNETLGKLKEAPTLEEMQRLVGGYIEVIPERKLGKLTGRLIVMDEEGKLKGKPVNRKATEKFRESLLPGDVLVGTVLVAEKGEID
jgi:hypothetical protein